MLYLLHQTRGNISLVGRLVSREYPGYNAVFSEKGLDRELQEICLESALPWMRYENLRV